MPKLLHGFWGIGDDVPRKRSLEDAACCAVLGEAFRRCTVPDNIYRYLPGSDEPVIKENENQFEPLEPDESYLIPLVTDFLRKNLPGTCELVAPLGIGSHRDHVLTRRAAERIGLPLWHYADYPYLVYGEHNLAAVLACSVLLYNIFTMGLSIRWCSSNSKEATCPAQNLTALEESPSLRH